MPRSIAISRYPSSASLYALAQAIVASFKFDFDHPFGFYSGKTPRTLSRAAPKYELFADIGEETDALSVEQTEVATAFPKLRHRMTFLFDYGDEWLFKVTLTGTGQKTSADAVSEGAGDTGQGARAVSRVGRTAGRIVLRFHESTRIPEVLR